MKQYFTNIGDVVFLTHFLHTLARVWPDLVNEPEYSFSYGLYFNKINKLQIELIGHMLEKYYPNIKIKRP